MPKSLFDEFTNVYSLSKTLRFELAPIGNTQKMLEDDKVFEKDRIIKEKYQKTKLFIDRFHREFIETSLVGERLDELDYYYKVFSQWKDDKKTFSKQLFAIEKKLRQQIVSSFDKQAKKITQKYPEVKFKKKNKDALFEDSIFLVLKNKYGKEEDSIIKDESSGKEISIFDSWKGFCGYFTKFFETRKNFYKDDATATAVATRIIDDNLRIFCDNISLVQSLREKVDFSEIKDLLGGVSLNDFFGEKFFNFCLTQKGIDSYNRIIGGETTETGEKIKGINEVINLYRQRTKEKIPFLKLLKKQILSEKTSIIEQIESDKELLEVLQSFKKETAKKTKLIKSLISGFLKNSNNFDLSHIYISKEALNTILHKWISEKESVENVFFTHAKSTKRKDFKYEKASNTYKYPDFIEFSFLKGALLRIPKEVVPWKEVYCQEFDFLEKDKWQQFLGILGVEFEALFSGRKVAAEKAEAKGGYDIFSKKLHVLLKDFRVNKDSKIVIKNYADSVLSIYQMAKYFSLEKKRKWVGEYDLGEFYTNPSNGYLLFYDNAYEEIVKNYNKLRNYLTKKPFSEEKWKLNFSKSNLLTGWADSPRGNTQYFGFIFRNESEYLLGLSDYPKLFDEKKFPEAFNHNGEKYEKMNYRQLSQKTLCGSVYNGIFNVDYKDDKKSLSESDILQKLKKVLESKKDIYPGLQGFIDKIEKGGYKNTSNFFKEIEEESPCYELNFVPISKEYLLRGYYKTNENSQNNSYKKLYLFKIKNKDWNKGSKGAKNLHTMYFENVFSELNASKGFPIKLEGGAEIFYRPKTDKDKLGFKKDKKGKKVVDHKRYSQNKILFHVPIKLNRTKGDARKFNVSVNNFLAEKRDVNVIGIDRGEKNLAYYSIIDRKGNCLEKGDLNLGYHVKLEEVAKKREQERKDWREIEKIKDLKKGYISQVVRKIVDLAIKHNAIVVLEDLNTRFKQIRSGIEKSVYQQLEKALIEKFQYVVNKKEDNPENSGHLLKAFQLTAPVESLEKIGKQTGIIFYTQASYTSKIDPVTGWRPNIFLRYTSAQKAKQEILKLSKIEFRSNVFAFEYDIRNFVQAKEYPGKTIWVLHSSVERFHWNRKLNQGKGSYDKYSDVTQNFRDLFQKYNIDFEKRDILTQIESLEIKGNEKFFRDFIFFLNLVCQIRNTNKEEVGDENDFILSPVEPFFDSRNANKYGKGLPNNGDANGAFNIARKGLIILNKISKFSRENKGCDRLQWKDIYISGKEWDDFAQDMAK